MTSAERMLVLVLRLFGAVMLLAFPAAMMPFAWMDQIHHGLGMGELPARPIVEYLARSCSLLYALHGAVVMFVSTNVRVYLPVIRFLGWAGIVFGGVTFLVDASAGMPSFWTLSEGAIIVTESCLLLYLAGRVSAGLGNPPAST